MSLGGLGDYSRRAGSGNLHPERTPLTDEERAIRDLGKAKTEHRRATATRHVIVYRSALDAWIKIWGVAEPIECFNVPAVDTLAAKIAARLNMKLIYG